MRGIVITERYTTHTDNLTRYLSELRNNDLLSADEEYDLFLKYKEGDERAKEIIIKGNLRFVVSVAKQYQSKSTPLEDLISEGNKGLIEGIEKFDPSLGFKFISYGVWYIRKHIHYYLNDLSRTVRIPAKITSDLRKYRELESSLSSNLGRTPTIEETLSYIEENNLEGFQFSERTIESIKNNPSTVALDPIKSGGSDEESFHPIDWIEEESNSPDRDIEMTEKKEIINKMLAQLSVIEKEIIIMKYGIRDGIPLAYKEIGMKMERTPEWARGNTKKAEKRLRIIARKMGIKDLSIFS